MQSEPTLFQAVGRYKVAITLVTVLAVGAGLGLSLLQRTLYQATGEVLLSDPRTSGGIAEEIGLVLDPGRYVRNQAQVFGSPQVATEASQILGGALTPKEVMDNTSATPARDLDTVTIRGTDPTAEGSVALVDALVAGYEIVVERDIQGKVDNSIATLEASKAETQASIAEYDAILAENPDDAVTEARRNAAITQLVSLDQRIEALTTNAALYGSGVQLYVPPEFPESPVQPQPIRNAAIAGVLGLIAAGAYAWWRADRRPTNVEHRNDPAPVLEAPLLGVVPAFGLAGVESQIPTAEEPTSMPAEAYHFVASFVGFALQRIEGKVVLITSTGTSDGKTVTVANLGIAAAKDGSYPLLIDADERARGLSRLAGLNDKPGITDLTVNGESMSLVISTWRAGDIDLMVVPAGSKIEGNTPGYFRSMAFREALPKLTVGRDLVLIDAPPILAVSETMDLAAIADGVVLVVQPRTPLKELETAREQLAMVGTPLLGYVYNSETERSEYGYYGYGYGYGYGHGEDD